MKVLILDRQGNVEVTNINCRPVGIEVASWEIIGESLTLDMTNKEHTMRCFYDAVFGWDITDEDELKKYINPYINNIFSTTTTFYNTVVIVGMRHGKYCDIRKKDIDCVKEIIAHEKNIRGIIQSI